MWYNNSMDTLSRKILDACTAFHKRLGDTPEAALAPEYPEDVVLSKMESMADAGEIEYGVSLRTAWVVEPGRGKKLFGLLEVSG